MKVLKQIFVTAVAICVLALSAMAEEPQKNDPKGPPPKPRQEVRQDPKPPPPPRDNSGNKGDNSNRRGKP
ncbi:MAG TPA: hypothetical protein VK422_13400 [Pyrinomonadaceae bacterium]|nr:hypothetical protein [Pyrinomonadaceae bacterium]